MGRLIENPELRDRAPVFENRREAGRALATMLLGILPGLSGYKGAGALVLAIPAGGVPVASEIASGLGLEMDLLIVRKIQIPYNPEAGFGALSPDGEAVFNEPLLERLGLSKDKVDEQVKKTMEVLKSREEKFRGGASDKSIGPEVKGRPVILVDDGLASGYTMIAAIRHIKKKAPSKVVVAVPTASQRAVDFILGEADEVVCPNVRGGFTFAVAEAYRKWHDLSDDEVLSILKEHKAGLSKKKPKSGRNP